MVKAQAGRRARLAGSHVSDVMLASSGLGIVGAGMLRLVDGWPLQAKQGHITVIL